MDTYIGIDLGTSSVKALLVAENGSILHSVCETHPIFYPQSGWSEQNPEDWYICAVHAVRRLLKGQEKKSVKGISFGGQMHGLVLLDAEDRVIRPAILWNDGRTQEQTDWLNNVIGMQRLSDYTANIAFAGFTAPKLLWVKEHEPEHFARISKIMLPKDYLAYRFSGCFGTDVSDAAGMLLLDVKNRTWSEDMCRICGIDKSWLPKLYESSAVSGQLTEQAAKTMGLTAAVKIVAGAGDNAAAAVGTATVGEGACNISLGTSGTVFVSSSRFQAVQDNVLHSFCHADGGYHLMGCILSAASCNQWWIKKILTGDFSDDVLEMTSRQGKNSVFFLPYLMGERSPHNDVFARGAFIGMRPDTERAHMSLAVLEGVAYALKDCVEIAKAGGIAITKTKICGGGAKSGLWRQIVANILGIPVEVPKTEEGPAYGAALLAMTGCGVYKSVTQAVASCVSVKEIIEPDQEIFKQYEARYAIFRSLYAGLQQPFHAMALLQ